MSDKVQLIKQEIERRINLIQDTNVTSYADGWIQAYKELLQFIDSLPEEPVSKDLDFLVIGLEETIGTSPHSREVIKEYLQKAAEWGRNHFEDKSEMVSEDLEKAASKYVREDFHERSRADFKAGAEWQKEQDFEELLKSDISKFKECYEKGKADAINQMKETLQTEYEKGRFDMREEIMKNAIDATILDIDAQTIEFGLWPEKLSDIKEGDKVKIIIIK